MGELRRNIDDMLEHLRSRIGYPPGSGSTAVKPPMESFVEASSAAAGCFAGRIASKVNLQQRSGIDEAWLQWVMRTTTPNCDCCLMEKTDARVRAEFYPSDPQGKKSAEAFLGFLCDECFFHAHRPGSPENFWLLKQVGLWPSSS
jgi:hypothetical protein